MEDPIFGIVLVVVVLLVTLFIDTPSSREDVAAKLKRREWLRASFARLFRRRVPPGPDHYPKMSWSLLLGEQTKCPACGWQDVEIGTTCITATMSMDVAYRCHRCGRGVAEPVEPYRPRTSVELPLAS